jgi:predicted dehydrogenase
VILLTPPNTHLDLCARPRQANTSCWKSLLEITVDRSRELVETAEQAGVLLGIVLQWRFRPTINILSEMIEDGRFGEIVSVSMRLNNWRPQSYYDEPGRGTKSRDGGGVLLTQAIHTVDQMIALAGLPAEVSGYAVTSEVHRMETEDLVHAAMRFDNGAIGAISATTAAYPGFPDGIDILGTKGSARIDGQGAKLAFMDGTEEAISDGVTGDGAGANPMAFFAPEPSRRFIGLPVGHSRWARSESLRPRGIEGTPPDRRDPAGRRKRATRTGLAVRFRHVQP